MAEVLRGFMAFLNNRPQHHATDNLKIKKSGERKRPTLILPKSGTIYVQLTNIGTVLRTTLG